MKLNNNYEKATRKMDELRVNLNLIAIEEIKRKSIQNQPAQEIVEETICQNCLKSYKLKSTLIFSFSQRGIK